MQYSTKVGTKLVKKEKESGKLRMAGGSWTINLEELPELIDQIVYITPKHTYTINRADAFEYGFVRYFAGEKKLVVPLNHWSIK